MGYTNYLQISKDCPANLFSVSLKKCVRQVVKHGVTNKVLAGSDGSGKPKIINDGLLFNGVGDENSHESCEVPFKKPNKDFFFCKTAQKEYDKYVLCVWFVVKLHLGNHCVVSSDGYQEEPEVPNGYHAYCDEEVTVAYELLLELFPNLVDKVSLQGLFSDKPLELYTRKIALEQKNAQEKRLLCDK